MNKPHLFKTNLAPELIMQSSHAHSVRDEPGSVLCHRFVPPLDSEKLGDEWRNHIQPFFKVSFRPETDLSIAIAMRSYHLGEVLIGDVRAPAHTLQRTPEMIEQQGLDHVLLQFYRSGHSIVETPSGTNHVLETQCAVFDLAQPVQITAAAVDATNLVLPRRLLQEQGCSPEGLHGCALDHDGDPFGRLLHAFLINVVACGDRLQQHEASSISHAIVKLCGSYLRGRATSPVPTNFDVSIRVRRLIEEELHNPALTPALIAQKLRISRSALYRLFGETGGVLAYIRDRRLMRAMRILVRDDGIAPRRVTKLAYAVGFSDEKTFQRAFSRRFGFVPSETISYRIGNENQRMDTPVLRSWIDNL